VRVSLESCVKGPPLPLPLPPPIAVPSAWRCGRRRDVDVSTWRYRCADLSSIGRGAACPRGFIEKARCRSILNCSRRGGEQVDGGREGEEEEERYHAAS